MQEAVSTLSQLSFALKIVEVVSDQCMYVCLAWCNHAASSLETSDSVYDVLSYTSMMYTIIHL